MCGKRGGHMHNDIITLQCGLVGACIPCMISYWSPSMFAMTAFDCCLCQVSVTRYRTIGLFGPKGVKERLFLTISDLLDVPVDVNNGVSDNIFESASESWIIVFLNV